MYLSNNQYDKTKSNIFSICESTWNSESGNFYEMNKTDEIRCCFDRCNKPVKNCKSFCENTFKKNEDKKSCLITCSKQKVLCEDNCKAYVEWDDNPFVECVKNSECINNFIFNTECVKKNRKELVECCKNSCTQTNDYNCDELCEASASVLENLEVKKFQKPLEELRQKNRNYTIYVVIFFAAIAVIIVVKKRKII